MKILVVDDERDIIDLISANLRREGYQVVSAETGEDALELVKMERPDLVVLDLMLPGIEGLEVCRQIRGAPDFSSIPILILSAKCAEVDRVLGLEMGADDYITKPFSVRELVSRVRVWLRRTGGGNQKRKGHEQIFNYRDISINFDRYEVSVNGRKVDLSPTEMKLLFFLTKNPGRVYTRDQLLSQVWEESFVTPRSVDVHVSRLRKLIEKNPQKPSYIVTVTGVGYKFDDSER